jgi:hypothetical protein
MLVSTRNRKGMEAAESKRRFQLESSRRRVTRLLVMPVMLMSATMTPAAAAAVPAVVAVAGTAAAVMMTVVRWGLLTAHQRGLLFALQPRLRHHHHTKYQSLSRSSRV